MTPIYRKLPILGILITANLILGGVSAQALPLKKGQVLSPEGEVFNGASPEQAANIAANAKREDWAGNKKTSGIVGQNLFVVVEDQPVFVPLGDLRGKSKETVREIVKQQIIGTMTERLQASYTNQQGVIDSAGLNESLDSIDLTNDEVIQGLAETAANAAAHSEKPLEQAQQVIEDSLALAEKTMSDPAFERQLEQNIEELHQSLCAGQEGSGSDSGMSDGNGGSLSC